jgi:hypothetical protein
MEFYLGAPHGAWLSRTAARLFVSRRTLSPYKTLPRALGPWALDSGGFTEITQNGSYELSAPRYALEVRRLASEVGRLEWASTQDWMCEDAALARTGRTVAEHQALSIRSYLELRDLAPEIEWLPVLQGQHFVQYWDHVEMYARAGVDLASLPRVGVGSVCRRQNTTMGSLILSTLAGSYGLRLHGFGFKLSGLRSLGGESLVSADSMAWSVSARRSAPLAGCVGRHQHCTTCLYYAMLWRARVLFPAEHQEAA